MATESTPLKPVILVNDDLHPPSHHNVCREIFGGIVQLLVVFPLLLIFCIIISPVLLYWIYQIFFVFDPRGVNNGQPRANTPRVDEVPDTNTRIGTIKILFILPDGGYDPAEVSIMYHTLKSYKKYETDEIRIIFATPSGAIDTVSVDNNVGPTPSGAPRKAFSSFSSSSSSSSSSGTVLEVFAYGCDPLFKSSFGFGLFFSPFVDTLYRDMLQSVDWCNSRFKTHSNSSYKQVISFEEIETDDMTEIYDGVYVAGGHHWNLSKLFKNRMLHYKLSKLWQLSLDRASGLTDPIQFAAIGRGVAILAYALYTRYDDDPDPKFSSNDGDSKHSKHSKHQGAPQQLEEIKISSGVSGGQEATGVVVEEEELEVSEVSEEMRRASRYDSDTDSDGETSGGTGARMERMHAQGSNKVRANLRSVLYHVSVTTLPAWCEMLGNMVAWVMYGKIFSVANPHMQSCAQIVMDAVGDGEKLMELQQEKKFYHKGPQNWMVWLWQSMFEFGNGNDFRLTYVVEDSHIVTGRWFVDAKLVATRFMAKMVDE